jgi:SOS-response transcriptional repressor LexA
MSLQDGRPPEEQKDAPAKPGTLHQDHEWTPEGLRAELEAEGADIDQEVAKLRAIGRELREKHPKRAPGEAPPAFEIGYPAFEESVAAGPPNWVGDGCQAASMTAKQMLGDPGDDCVWVKVRGDSMRDADIPDGAHVLVNRKLAAREGDVVFAHIAGRGQVLKRLRRSQGQRDSVTLESATEGHVHLLVEDPSNLTIHGVAIACVKRLPRGK